MALEALIRVKRGRAGRKRQGDVICVKLVGSPWGEEEEKQHQVIPWTDASLQTTLEAARDGGEAFPVAVLPYLITVEVEIINADGNKTPDPLNPGSNITKTVTRTRSRRHFDVRNMTNTRLKNRILNNRLRVRKSEIQADSDALARRLIKTSTVMNAEETQNKTDDWVDEREPKPTRDSQRS